MKPLRIAIQKSGRLTPGSIEFLRRTGLEFSLEGRTLVTPCQNYACEILQLRSRDIPEYVSRGIADFGIVGQNVLKEYEPTAKVCQKLDFGYCRLVLAVPESSAFCQASDLNGVRIATAYPGILGEYLAQNGLRAEVVYMSGSVEAAPALGLAEAICDLVQTGNTLKANALRSLTEVMESQAILIQSARVKIPEYNLTDLLCKSLVAIKTM